MDLSLTLRLAKPPTPDFNGNGTVDISDFLLFVDVFGSRRGEEKYDSKYDLDVDGEIGIPDFLIFIDNFGKVLNRAPVFTSELPVTLSVDENTPSGQPIGDPISATDGDGDTLTYRLSGADADSFAIDDSTGQLQAKGTYNFEQKEKYSLTIHVSEGEGGEASLAVNIAITDIAEPPMQPAPPSVAAIAPTSLRVIWTEPVNTGPEITDYDVQYRLADSDDVFTDANYDGTERSLRLTGLFSSTRYAIQVRATNEEGMSAWSESGEWRTSELLFSGGGGGGGGGSTSPPPPSPPPSPSPPSSPSLDNNQVPVFNEGTSTTRNLAENTIGIKDIGNPITATDSDGGTPSYRLEGTDATSFTINANDGQLQTQSGETYDYENKSSYKVNVRVEDGQGGSNTIEVTINLTDINEPPSFTSEATFKVAENISSVGTLTAKDVDNADRITGYTITGGDDQKLFEIISTNELRFKDDPDFENPTDTGSNNEYSVVVTTTGGTGTRALAATQPITVIVTDVDELREGRQPKVTVDYDADGNGLIEVSSLDQLNAIRYDLNGNGVVDDSKNKNAYASAFSNATSMMGCPSSGCTGYELATDLDFNDPDSYDSGTVNAAWTTGSGWEPIGTSTNNFTATFHGGGHTLSNLFIDRNSGDLGLFGISSGTLQNVGLVSVDVMGNGYTGGLVGQTTGTISATYVMGQVGSSTNYVGGLVGQNNGLIRTSYSKAVVINALNGGGLVGINNGTLLACYSTGNVSTSRNAGGLISWNRSSGSIVNCYATGSVSSSAPDRVGGLLGTIEHDVSTVISANYWDTETSGRNNSIGSLRSDRYSGTGLEGKTTLELQTPIGYSDIYLNWDDEDVTGDGVADTPWDIGTMSHYPVLKIDFNGDGTATWQEFGDQRILDAPKLSSVTLDNQLLTVAWNAPIKQGGPAISAYDVRHIAADQDMSVDENWTLHDNAWTSGSLEYTTTVSDNHAGYAVQVRAEDANTLGPWSRILLTHSTTWTNFVKANANGTEPILPDFSYAGYHYFSKPVPNVTHRQFNVADYGAIPNDNKSDHSAIEAAIAAAEANGSGIVFFSPGEFLVNTDADTTDEGEHTPIYIRASNIVLKGSGSRDGGTVIRQVNYLLENSPGKRWTVPYMFTFEPTDWPGTQRWGTKTRLAYITQEAARETFWITVLNASELSVGQWIVLYMQRTSAVGDFLSPYSAPGAWTDLSARGITMSEKHSIAEIDGNRVRLNEPLHAIKINPFHRWSVYAFSPILEEVGVEDISFHGSWLDEFVHHKDFIHNSGWSLLAFQGCVNSWMRRLSFVNTNRAYKIEGSAAISVYQITAAGNPAHFSSITGTSYGTWQGLIEELADHRHGLNVTHNTTGNVYWRADQIENQTLDCHASQPYANLYDLINRGKLSGHGGSIPNYPNHLRHLVVWNFYHDRASADINGSTRDYDFWRSPHYNGQHLLKPIIVGMHGEPANNIELYADKLEVLESLGKKVKPESLFEAQLKLRLGTLPTWLSTLQTEWTSLRAQTLTIPTILPSGTIADQTLTIGESETIDVANDFILHYNESMSSYSAMSSDESIVKTRTVDSTVTFEAVSVGSATITVTATASEGSIAKQKFDISVTQ